MNKQSIKINQIWQNKRSPDYQVLVTGKRGDKFNAKVLTEVPNIFKGTHKLSRNTLWSKFDLIK